MPPEVIQGKGFYRFNWLDKELQITLKRSREHKAGHVTGEISITTTAPGYRPLLHQAQFNLSSTRSRAELAKRMAERYSEADWDTVLEEFCHLALLRIRQGEPPIELWTSMNDIAPPEYLLKPLFPIGKPTVIFGEGGIGKSLLALVFSICIALPWIDNPLGLVTSEESTKVLYLDYETDWREVAWRMKCLKNGLQLPDVSLNYRKCALPLADDVEQIQEVMSDTGARCLIVDSLGAACGGDLNSAETAIRFFSALRQLDTTPLIVAHTSKDQMAKTKSIYGSAFFHNFPRSVWEIKAVQEIGEDEINVGFFHRKSNVAKLHTPLGFQIAFGNDSISVERRNMSDIPGLVSQLPTAMRIRNALRDEPMSIEELKEELEISRHNIEVTVYRMRDKGQVIKVDNNKWGLATGNV